MFNNIKKNIEYELTDTNRKRIERAIYNYIISKYRGLVGSGRYSWSAETDGEGDEVIDSLPKNLIFDLKFEY